MLEIAIIAGGIWWITKDDKPKQESAFICTVVEGKTICQRRDGTGTPFEIAPQKADDLTVKATAIEGAWFAEL